MNLWGWVNSTAGRSAVLVVGLAGLLSFANSFRTVLGRSEAARVSQQRLFICAETGKAFVYQLKRSDTIPVRSPHSGRRTGYPAELCFWTADGAVKQQGTPVLLNRYRGIPEPTFCPECGRLVVQHNPPAERGIMPPPTREEYLREMFKLKLRQR